MNCKIRTSLILICCIIISCAVCPHEIYAADPDRDKTLDLTIPDQIDADATERYTCHEFTALVSKSFTVDDTSIDNYVSLYGENVTVGVSMENNAQEEDVALFTEDDIDNIASETELSLNNDTVKSISEGSDGSITASRHEMTTFSDNAYPAVYVVYEGDDVYIEEYILTTEEYKYTIVISANNEKDVALSGIDSFKNSFTVYGHTITHAEKADNKELLIIFIAALVVVICVGIFVVIRLRRNSKTSS